MSRHEDYECLLACRDDLSAAEERKLAAHLDTCTECRAAAAVFARHDASLRRVARQQPRAMLHDRVLSALDARESDQHRSHVVLPYSLVACAAALLLFALGSWHRVLSPSIGQHAPRSQLAVTELVRCTAGGQGWNATGRCRILPSVSAFRGPHVVLYAESWKWVQENLQHTVLIVRKDEGTPPVTYSPGATNVSFSEVAFDAYLHMALYAVGQEKEQGQL